jgi:hypothetical protein
VVFLQAVPVPRQWGRVWCVLGVSRKGVSSAEGVIMRRSSIRGLSHRVIALEVKAVNAYVPRRLLLFYVNLLDRRVPPKVKTSIVDGIGKLPEDVRSSILVVADEYVPQDVDNSWKFCSVVAGICKYIPEKIIPMCSAERWEKIRSRYHIPTLIDGTQPRGPSLN